MAFLFKTMSIPSNTTQARKRIRPLRPEGLPDLSGAPFSLQPGWLAVRAAFFSVPYQVALPQKRHGRLMVQGQSFSGAVTLDYATPPEDLRAHLSFFYEFRADVAHWEAIDKADRAQFRFLLSGSGEYQFADGTVQRIHAVEIVGPTTGPTTIRMDGPAHSFGVGLLPAGWGTLLDFEASLLLNRAVDAAELFGGELHQTGAALRAAATLDEKVAIGSALARMLIRRGSSTAFNFTRMVDDWLASSPSPDIDDLVRATGLSHRQVERHCNTYYGAPPKMLARKYRALKAAIALARGEAEMSDLIADGFYDQSHFIREIKHFTGVTPTQLVDDLPEFATLTLKRAMFEDIAERVSKT
jgi:AraC-like DNA-binding protein